MLKELSRGLKSAGNTLDLSALKLRSMKETSTLGSRLTLAMDEEGIKNDAALAEAVGTTGATIHNWKKDKVQLEEVKAALAIRVAKKLRIRVEWLVLKDGPMRAEGITSPQVQPADPWAAVEELSLVQARMAQVLAESIPTAGRALVETLARFDRETPDGEYLTTLLGALRRELAKQDAAALHGAGRKARGSKPRKRQ